MRWLRCGHFWHYNQFLLNQWCAPSIVQFANVYFLCEKEFECSECKDIFKKIFQRFWLVYALLLRMKACTLHIEWFPWHQEPQQPQWPQQPQQRQWPQWPLQPHFIKKLTELDVSISPDTKMTYPSLLMWDGPSKIHFFIDFWHPSSWRLWRTGMLLLTKLKGHRSNFHYSGFPNHPQTKSSLNISICQSQI